MKAASHMVFNRFKYPGKFFFFNIFHKIKSSNYKRKLAPINICTAISVQQCF